LLISGATIQLGASNRGITADSSNTVVYGVSFVYVSPSGTDGTKIAMSDGSLRVGGPGQATANLSATGALTVSGTGNSSIAGKLGVGSTSPFAKLSIHANNNDTNRVLFAIGSSTATATTTLFSISNTGNVTQSAGSNATTTHTFGSIGDSTSHSCFNTKNTAGSDISFYFVGTTLTVENNSCR
jgi:hypothetical protein